jgi:putative transposase
VSQAPPSGAIGQRCHELIRQKGDEKGWMIWELAIHPDHVHRFVRVWPSISAADVVKECKGSAAFILRKEFPELHTLPSLWTRSFCGKHIAAQRTV